MFNVQIPVSIVLAILTTGLVTTIVGFIFFEIQGSFFAEPEDPTASLVEALQAQVQSQQAQLDKLEAVSELMRERMGRGFNPDNRNETMPRYRTPCWRGQICMKKKCPFTHAEQRELFGDAIAARPNFFHGGEVED